MNPYWPFLALMLTAVLFLVLIRSISHKGITKTPFDEILKTRRQILEDLARNAPLIEVLEHIIHRIEAGQIGVLGSFFIVDRNDIDLSPPNDSHDYVRCLVVHHETQESANLCNDCLHLSGVDMFGPSASQISQPACMTAILENRPVVITDTPQENTPETQAFLAWGKPLDITGCWSEPITGTQGDVLGAVTLYYRQGRKPHPEDQELFDLASHLSIICIERKRAENQQFLMQSFVDHASDPVHLMSPEQGFRLCYANESAIRHFGYPLAKLRTMCLPDWDPNYSLDDLQAFWIRLQQERTITIQTEHTTATGQTVPVEISFYPLHNAGRDYVAGTFRNIQERKKTEAALIAAKQAIEENARVKSEFMTNMFHELRTPLNAIFGFTELMREDRNLAELSPECAHSIREYLDNMQTSSMNLMTLINDLLDFSRIDAGTIILRHSRFNLTDLVGVVLKSESVKPNNEKLMVYHTMDKNIPASLVGDSVRVAKILTHLLSNAVKFTPGGEIVLDIRLRELTTHIAQIHFSVRDTGIGISDEEQAKLFKAFSQVDGSSTRQHGGLGLGLVICAHLVRAMGGDEIRVKSTPGVGTTFSFCLTFERRDEALTTAPKSVSPHTHASTRRLAGVKVLLVEDNRVNQLIETRLLQKMGAEVTVADNGQIAVDRMEENSGNYDLILMDIQMPVMNGYEATQIIRQKLNLRLPIIAVSANSSEEDQQHALYFGMDAFISKPVVSQTLEETLNLFVTPEGHIITPVMKCPAYDKPIIDRLTGLENADGDNELYVHLILLFIEEHAEDAAKLRQCMADSAYQDAHRIVHTLKSVSASLGLLRLARLARHLDVLFKSSQIEPIRASLSELEQELTLTLTELNNTRI
ncbi:MAG: ATP-binding protein [Methylococcaceae bacterium]